MRTRLRVGAVLAAAMAVLLSGCGTLSTSASMLVEVDVYKGPLTKSKTIQFGELVAVFDEASVILDNFSAAGKALVLQGPEHANRLSTAIGRADDLNKLVKSFPAGDRNEALRTLNAAAANLSAAPGSAERLAAEKTLADAKTQATRIATALKIEAFYWAESQIGGLPTDARVRSMLVAYINLASELANQIASRTDTLDKQLRSNGEGAELALSDHLKDAGPTEFLHLYEWYDATLPDQQSSGINRLTPEDRARLAKRLFSDHFWTRINQVHASGQGEVRMALVKDDIGNWNLKSFDNNPEELLGAYRQLSLAGVQAGIRVAQAVGTGGGAAGLDLASQFARGRLGSTEAAMAGSARIDTLRARVTAELEGILADMEAKAGELAENERKAQLDSDTKRDVAATRSSEYRRATEARVAVAALLQAESSSGASEERIKTLRNQLDKDAATEDLLRTASGGALDSAREAKTKLDEAQGKHREFVEAAFARARTAVEVHRRVLEGYKELSAAFGGSSGSRPTPAGR